MTSVAGDRSLPWDWYPGKVPLNVTMAPTAYLETTFSFFLMRSERERAVTIGHGASAYLATMFDVGVNGHVSVGDYALINGARLICDAEITIGDYALISWNVLVMDSYRVPSDPDARRAVLRRVAGTNPRRLPDSGEARPVRIGRTAWIGFNSCILPGVTIGEGAVVGACSVVSSDVPPFTIAAGNPAHIVRRLTEEEIAGGR